MTSLAIYTIGTVLITVWAFGKSKSIAYKFVWAVYAVIAVSSLACVVFQDQLLGHGGSLDFWYDLRNTTLWGYLLLLICCCIAFRPFSLFDKDECLKNFCKSERAKHLCSLFAWVFIIMTAVFIALSLSSINTALHASDYGSLRSDLYDNSENESNLVIATNPIANICFKLCLQFKYLSIFVVCAMLKENHKKSLALVLLCATFFDYYIYTTANASRGGLLIFCFCSLIIVLGFYRYFSSSMRRLLRVFTVIAGGIVISYVAAVTVSRFADDGGGGNAIVRNIAFYLGHAPIEFSRITGSLNEFANGDVILGRLSNHYFGTPYSWDSLSRQIGYPQIGPLFVTYLGFIYCDIGPIGCILFFLIWSQVMNTMMKYGANRPSTIFFFMYYMHYFVTGAFVVGRLEYASLITSLVIWLGIRLLEECEDFYSARRVHRARRVLGYDARGRIINNSSRAYLNEVQDKNVWN